MKNDIFRKILEIGETQEEQDYYCLVLGDNANISELKSMISKHLNCDLFDENLLNIKIIKKELCNAYSSLGEYNCVEIYYDNKCITVYFLGDFDFYDASKNRNILNLDVFELPRDCCDKEFEEAAKGLYPNLPYDVVYDSCIIFPFSGKKNKGIKEVDPNLMVNKWLEIKDKKIRKNNFSIFCEHAV